MQALPAQQGDKPRVEPHVNFLCHQSIISSFLFDLFQGGQDILSMMGQLMKPKKTEITGEVQIQQ